MASAVKPEAFADFFGLFCANYYVCVASSCTAKLLYLLIGKQGTKKKGKSPARSRILSHHLSCEECVLPLAI